MVASVFWCSLAPALIALVLLCGANGVHALNTFVPEAEKAPWERFLHNLHTITVNHQGLDVLLGHVLDYKFSLPQVQLRKGTVYVGSNFRLRRVVRDMMSGRRQVKVAVVGGSISWGHGASKRGTNDWVSILSTYLTKTFANVTVHNGCIPGTPSSFMSLCLEMSVEPDVDLVFAEYIVNDGWVDTLVKNPVTRQFERLVRRVLGLRRRPAMVFMQMTSHGMAFPFNSPHWIPFHATQEDMHGALAQYYDLPYLSFRTATYRLANFLSHPAYNYSAIMDTDYLHPADGGHKIMADLAVWLIMSTALDLIEQPYGEVDHAMHQEELPFPMIPGNFVPSTTLCAHDMAFKSLPTQVNGFEFVNEGTEVKPKRGFVSWQPGSSLTLTMNTLRTEVQQVQLTGAAARAAAVAALVEQQLQQQKQGQGQQGGQPQQAAANGSTSSIDLSNSVVFAQNAVAVSVSYLKSYENMGVARMECVEGCVCKAKEVDAHHDKHESTMYLATLDVSQAQRCVLRVTVLDKSSSGKHKFKVSGVMVSDAAKGVGASSNPNHLRDGVWEGQRFYADLSNEEGR